MVLNVQGVLKTMDEIYSLLYLLLKESWENLVWLTLKLEILSSFSNSQLVIVVSCLRFQNITKPYSYIMELNAQIVEMLY